MSAVRILGQGSLHNERGVMESWAAQAIRGARLPTWPMQWGHLLFRDWPRTISGDEEHLEGVRMQSHETTIGDQGEVVIPVDIRRKLGLEEHGLVVFVVRDDGIVEMRPRVRSLEDVFGSVPALPNESADLEAEIEQAMEEHAVEKYRRLTD
jgi:AbrB family looped-hinge helix DNA binding protein